MYRLHVILVLASTALAGPVASTLHSLTDETPISRNNSNSLHRLPDNIRPISYDLRVTTNIHRQDDFSFGGEVLIRFQVLRESRTITLHQRQLTIGSTALVRAGDPLLQSIELSPFEYDSENEFLSFTLIADHLIVGAEYILSICYNGTLRTDLSGFYRSSYLAADGNRRWLASTHFEPTDARHAFPCFDEPALRAFFAIRITHGSSYYAVSNMPIASTEPYTTDLITTYFEETTAPISTYLIAFMVSDLESRTKTNAAGFVQRIFARSTAIEDTEFGLDIGLKALDNYEQYFGIPFTFPKMDQAALPDYPKTAMEQWGFVTYREELLLYNESVTTFNIKRRISGLIVHEYLHQWFGNLVTQEWWSYNWIKEGLATLYEYYASDWLFPEWRLMDAFLVNNIQVAMISDANINNRPMTYPVESIGDVNNLFDYVAYSKSGSVFYMFMNAFTHESFRKGLIQFLIDNEFGAVSESELFSALEEVVKKDGTLREDHDVATIFSTWSRQAGFPLVTVERNYANADIRFSQERYLNINGTSVDPSIWWIPINYAFASEPDFKDTAATGWFRVRSHVINDPGVGSTDWFLLNKRQTGYYRVKYDLRNYRLLADQLDRDFEVIHLTSRSQLIDDAFDLARYERLTYDVAFDLIKYMVNEVEFVPWVSAFRGLQVVDRLLAGSPIHQEFKRFVLNQTASLYNEVGLTAASGEHFYRKEIRNQVINWACRLASTRCLDETNAVLNDYLVNSVSIHQDHRAAILCGAVRNATMDQFNHLLTNLRMENNSNERMRLIEAISCTSNVDWAKRQLVDSIQVNSTLYRTPAERYSLFYSISGANQYSTSLAINFLEINLGDAISAYGQANVNNAILRLANYVVEHERSEQFEQLLAIAHDTILIYPETISNARAMVVDNNRWILRNLEYIEYWILLNYH